MQGRVLSNARYASWSRLRDQQRQGFIVEAGTEEEMDNLDAVLDSESFWIEDNDTPLYGFRLG